MIYLSDATYTVKNSKEETIIPTPTRKINFSIQQPFMTDKRTICQRLNRQTCQKQGLKEIRQ